jgi:S1-C subfamily serine protease
MKFKFVCLLLLVVSSFTTLIIFLPALAGSAMYAQFIQLLQPSVLGSAVVSAAGQSQPSENPTLQSSVSTSSSPSSSTSTSLPNVFQKVENSVVQITSTTSNPNEIIIDNGVPATGKRMALGSGFVYDNKGHIVTNYHVVTGTRKADVTFTDGNTYSANVVGKDPNSDLTVLQITGDFSQEKVIPIPLANSSAVRPGEQVIAIGNPFGLSGTITTGIVSAKGRLLPNSDTGFSIPDTIQTDAAINPGNSGGPLLNSQGQVIGMNTAIFSSTGVYSGVGFAIPSNTIAKEVPILIQNSDYVHPWIGISGGKISSDLARAAGLPANYKGVLVGSVQPGSPADKASLKGLTQDDSNGSPQLGDIIIAIDEHPVRQIDDIINYIESQKNVGNNIKLTVNRNGQIMDLTTTLQARSPQTNPTSSEDQNQQPSPYFGGLLPKLPSIPGFPKLPKLPSLLP